MIIAIDPGPVQSAYVLIAGKHDLQPIEFAKADNEAVLRRLEVLCAGGIEVVIERVASYGMAVGESVFETVHWSGRFCQAAIAEWCGVTRVPRLAVKMHICHDSRAKDANIVQALKDRFGGKGTKSNPGWFYGFAKDCWQAYALAVAYAEAADGEGTCAD